MSEATHGNPFDWNLKEVSEALGPLLHKVCKGSAGVKLKAVVETDGFNAWRVVAFWFQARSTNDSMSLLTMILNPDRAKDLSDSSVQKLAESLSAIVESLNSASKGKGKRKGKKGQWTQESSTRSQWQGTSQRQNAAGNRQPWPQPKEAGRAIEKPKRKCKGKGRSGGKAKGKGKGLTCYVCGGIGQPARFVPQ